jgi:hypothetical protein
VGVSIDDVVSWRRRRRVVGEGEGDGVWWAKAKGTACGGRRRVVGDGVWWATACGGRRRVVGDGVWWGEGEGMWWAKANGNVG